MKAIKAVSLMLATITGFMDIHQINKAKLLKLFDLVIVISLLLPSVWLIRHHTPWMDEAQSWLLVRDQSFSELFSNLHYEGHPLVWYLLLFPFVKFGFPYITEMVVHQIFHGIFVIIFYFKAPFNRPAKIGMLLGYFFLFEYGSIARSYIMFTLFITIALVVYENRFKKHTLLYSLMLFLTVNTHVYAAVMVIPIVLFDVYCLYVLCKENGKINTNYLYYLAVIVFAYVLLVLTLSGERQVCSEPSVKNQFFEEFGKSKFNFMFYRLFFLGQFKFAYYGLLKNPVYQLLLNGCLAFFVFFPLRKRFVSYFVPLFTTCALAFLFSFGYYTGLRQMGIIYLSFVFGFWTVMYANDTMKDKSRVTEFLERTSLDTLKVLVLLHAIFGILMFSTEFKHKYSGSADAADFIRSHGYDDNNTDVFAFKKFAAISILPLLEHKRTFIFPHDDAKGSYILWNKTYASDFSSTYEEQFDIARSNSKNKKMIVILNKDVDKIPSDFECIYKDNNPDVVRSNERFYLYRIKH